MLFSLARLLQHVAKFGPPDTRKYKRKSYYIKNYMPYYSLLTNFLFVYIPENSPGNFYRTVNSKGNNLSGCDWLVDFVNRNVTSNCPRPGLVVIVGLKCIK
jgi:hypothetical protein